MTNLSLKDANVFKSLFGEDNSNSSKNNSKSPDVSSLNSNSNDSLSDNTKINWGSISPEESNMNTAVNTLPRKVNLRDMNINDCIMELEDEYNSVSGSDEQDTIPAKNKEKLIMETLESKINSEKLSRQNQFDSGSIDVYKKNSYRYIDLNDSRTDPSREIEDMDEASPKLESIQVFKEMFKEQEERKLMKVDDLIKIGREKNSQEKDIQEKLKSVAGKPNDKKS